MQKTNNYCNLLPLSKNGIVKTENGVVNEYDGTINGTDGTIKIDKIINELNSTIGLDEFIIDKLKNILKEIIQNPGQNTLGLSEKLNVSIRTIKRDLKLLNRDIKFVGSRKTGGYYIKTE